MYVCNTENLELVKDGCVCVYLVAQSCPSLCVPMDCDQPGPSPWNFPGKNTGVGCISFSRGSSQPRDGTHISWVSCLSRQILYHQSHLGSDVSQGSSSKTVIEWSP